MDALRSSSLTDRLADIDRLIDRLLVGINNIVQAGRHHFDSAKVNAANRIYIRMKAFGDIENKSYEGVSAALGILIMDLRTHYAADIALLGLGEWLDQLEAAHLEFDTLFNQRNMEWADRPDVKLKDIRRRIDSFYRQIVDRINAAALLETKEGVYDDLIRQLNQEITYFNDHAPHHAKKDVAHVAVADIPTQSYTGKPVIVIPTVFFTQPDKPDVELTFAKDFTVTYKDNEAIGTATLIIHGKGAYTGTREITFQIKN
ncbi:MAG: DUF6261 family protein [Tannerella sp.]|nr:DUF6261 family protein [Tannerella sp.]